MHQRTVTYGGFNPWYWSVGPKEKKSKDTGYLKKYQSYSDDEVAFASHTTKLPPNSAAANTNFNIVPQQSRVSEGNQGSRSSY